MRGTRGGIDGADRNALRLFIQTLAVALAFGVFSSPASQAQSPADTTSSAWTKSWPVAAWVSGGLGVGFIDASPDNQIAQIVRVNVSAGPLLLTYRQSDAGPFESGDGVRDGAMLVGVRSSGRRLFAAGALGYAEARPYHRCECSGGPEFERQAHGLAYDVTLHANAVIPGVAVSFSGVTLAPRARYMAFTLALELGWFGS